MYKRIANLSKSNSFFLFGPRGTGKSTLIRSTIPKEIRYDIDLLDASNARRFLQNPSLLIEVIKALPKEIAWVFIDEVQKIPELLDLVHTVIESSAIKFALTGSSARKLKRGGANLLAGRAFVYYLYPLTSIEIGSDLDLKKILFWGTLPKILSFTDDEDKALFLEAYVHTYLKEEILEEQLVRKLEPFNKFLQVAAQSNGQIINYSNIAQDIGSNYNSVKTYFEILEDTLLGFCLPAYSTSIRKRQGIKPKFYFFDTGVKRALDNSLRTTLPMESADFGSLFESFIISEFIRLNSYLKRSFAFSFLRVDEKMEIDLIIDTPDRKKILVEIKSSEVIQERHLENLSHFAKDFPGASMYCLSQDQVTREFKGITVVHWREGLRRIFNI